MIAMTQTGLGKMLKRTSEPKLKIFWVFRNCGSTNCGLTKNVFFIFTYKKAG